MALRWLELAGPVGAGKSALLPAAMDAVRDAGATALTPGELVSGSRPGSRLRRTSAGMAFGVTEPRLSVAVARALLAAPLTWRHRRAIGTLMFRLAAASYASDRDGLDGYTVVDEGWVHRAVNLYGWTPGVTDDALAGYLSAIPRPDLLVVVGAPAEVRLDRIRQRGLPKRLRDKDHTVVDAFLRRSERIVERAAQRMERGGVRVIRIDNTGSITAAAGVLSTALRDAVEARPTHSAFPPVVRLRPPVLVPRPSLAMFRRGRSLTTTGQEFSAVLAAYGLPDAQHSMLDDRGRSLAVLVDTPGGPAVLKRYKPTLSTPSIECQHAILRELQRLEFPAPRLVPTLDGDTLVTHESGRYDLTAFVGGFGRWDRSLLLPSDGGRLRRDAGAALAGFHLLLADFEPTGDHEARVAGNGIPEGLEEAIAGSLADGPPAASDGRWNTLWARGDEMLSSLRTAAGRLDRADLPRTVVHGDYGPYNLLIRQGRPMHVMDLELSRRDWRAVDLARAIPRFGTNRRGFSPDRARSFLDGYVGRLALTADEQSSMSALRAYLDLRRSAISWGRYLHGGETSWLDAAVKHLKESDRARDPDHPLALVIDSRSGR